MRGPHPRMNTAIESASSPEPISMRFYRESRINSSCPGPNEFSDEEVVEDLNLFDYQNSRTKSQTNSIMKKDRDVKGNSPSLSTRRPEFKTSRDVQKTPLVMGCSILNQEAQAIINKRKMAMSTISKERSKITVGEC